MQPSFKTIIFLALMLALCQTQQPGLALDTQMPDINAGLKQCITSSFSSTCKSQLYTCFNTSDCSYQLHTNTQHIFLKDQDTAMAKIYFSNPLAVALHQCLNKQCNIGQMDKQYPSTLPADHCVLQVWDICGGDVQTVYAGKAQDSVMKCYRQLCPNLKNKTILTN